MTVIGGLDTRWAILVVMGLNPFRPQRRTPADYVFVAAGLIVCALLVVWAFFG